MCDITKERKSSKHCLATWGKLAFVGVVPQPPFTDAACRTSAFLSTPHPTLLQDLGHSWCLAHTYTCVFLMSFPLFLFLKLFGIRNFGIISNDTGFVIPWNISISKDRNATDAIFPFY
jgi:hypothetical protein